MSQFILAGLFVLVSGASQDAIMYYDRGLAKSSHGDSSGAISDFDQAAKLNPKSAEIYVARGLAKQTNGDLDGGVADFDQAIRLDRDFVEAYVNRGSARAMKGETLKPVSPILARP